MESGRERKAHQNPSDSNRESDKETEVKDGIDEIINQERVVIFSKSTCPYCNDAKEVFNRLGQSYSTVELTDHPRSEEVQSALKEMTGAGTVPRVFIDGKCIGGGSDTVKMYEKGELQEILRKRSAQAMGNNSDDCNVKERGSGEKFY